MVGDRPLRNVVEDSVRMQRAAVKAREHAKKLKKLIEDAGPAKPLADVLADQTNSGQKPDSQQGDPHGEVELRYQPIQTAVTAPFSWQASSPSTAASTGIPDPTQQGISEIPELPVPPGGQGAVREIVEWLLDLRGQKQEVLDHFCKPESSS